MTPKSVSILDSARIWLIIQSHAIAQAQPQLLLGAQIQRRPTAKKDGPAPLVDLKEAREKPVEKMGFTGKGLLRI